MMRQIKLPYGHEFREIEVPESNREFVAGPKQVPPLTDVGTAVASAIRHPNRTRRRIRITLVTDHISPSGAGRIDMGSTPHFAEALERALARQGCPAQIGVVTAGADVMARFGSQRSVQHA
jgi:hypothetical protein